MPRDRLDKLSGGPAPRSNPANPAQGNAPGVKPGIAKGQGRGAGTVRLDAKVTSPEVEKLIPIRGDGKSANHPGGPSDPTKFWLEYYRTHDETGEQLRETLRILNAAGKTQDVYAALSGYLNTHPKNRETWMYEAVAAAVEMIGKPAEAKKYLGWAADLALKSHNPNDLVSVADKLYLKGYYERIGPLLDEAAAKIPHRSEPLIMSINLSQQTGDPARMARSIRSLLSLGWPANDEYFRREARRQAETLAKTLREQGRAKEADDLIASLPEAEARDLYIRLSWSGDAAYDLTVEEPLGATASFAMPRTVFGGSILNDGKLGHPEEIYVCPRGFDGEYRIRVEETYSDPAKPADRIMLEAITHEGTPQERKQVFNLDPYQLSKPIKVKLEGGRRTTVLPFVNPIASIAPALEAHEKKRSKAVKPNPPVQVKVPKGDSPRAARDASNLER